MILPNMPFIGAGSSADIIEIALDGRVSLRNAYGLDGFSKNPAFDEPVVDLIIMQYTGLKDRKGNLIFEGDIVDNGTGKYIGVIEFKNGCFTHRNSPLGYFVEDGEVEDNRSHPDDRITLQEGDTALWASIIGNIYQNPELLNPTTHETNT